MASRKESPGLLEEHIASRKDWGRYLTITTKLHRSETERADDFLAHIRARLKEAKRQGQ